MSASLAISAVKKYSIYYNLKAASSY